MYATLINENFGQLDKCEGPRELQHSLRATFTHVFSLMKSKCHYTYETAQAGSLQNIKPTYAFM